jgi:spore maturation protein CgeB
MTRFLIVNCDYPAFLDSLYAQHPGLEHEPYARQLAVRNESLFGSSDFYPRNLNELGHPAVEVHINNRRLQAAWACEHDFRVSFSPRSRVALRRGFVPWLKRDQRAWMAPLLRAQIEEFRPDVILSHSLSDLPPAFWTDMRSHYRLLVGQIASPLAADIDLNPFGLMLSSLPNFVERFRAAGLRAELLPLAFDPIVLERTINNGQPVDVSFVGTLSPYHAERMRWLERLCSETKMQVWGQGIDTLPANSTIRGRYQGIAWGMEMYRVLRQSRISLNYHIDISGKYANNMRLFETTGVGVLLLTDWKENLADLFEPGVEAVVYRTPEECSERIRYYLEHEAERARIAKAGQERTLRDHTYRKRMQTLVSLVEPLLS